MVLQIKQESIYFLYKIYNDLYINKTKAKFYLEKLITLYPNNIVFKIEKYKYFNKNNHEYISLIRRDIKKNLDLETKQKIYLNSLL